MGQDKEGTEAKYMPESPKKFDTKPYVRKISKPWGYELHWTRDDGPYMGKLIHINAGARLSLQDHDKKTESWFLIKGEAVVIWQEEEGGELIETALERDVGYSCEVGQQHRLKGITDCDVIEVSTPEIGTTRRIEDDYNRSDETEEERDKRNKEATIK